MASHVKLEIAPDGIKAYTGLRIQQGEVCAGPQKQSTILRSCTCVGFYEHRRRIGAISHITGFGQGAGHTPQGALAQMRKALARHDVRIEDCECFVVGGADRARHVFDETLKHLDEMGVSYRILDSLGSYHRKIQFDPQTGVLLLYRKSGKEKVLEPKKAFSSDMSLGVFHDPKRRLLTGASLFFRNAHLVEKMRKDILPEVFRNGKRLHIWCAGCSNGMEAWSVAMVALDWIERRKIERANLRVLGSDVSADALRTAFQGVYPVSESSLDNNLALFKRYAEFVEPRLARIGNPLRRIVSFRERDIRRGSRQHRFELIICDHVMQYFKPEDQMQFLKGLMTGVLPGGFLYVSSPSSELAQTMQKQYGCEVLERSFYRSP